jgi:hypothetical protein
MKYLHHSTNSATTNDWLKASENMRISAFDPSSIPTTVHSTVEKPPIGIRKRTQNTKSPSKTRVNR